LRGSTPSPLLRQRLLDEVAIVREWVSSGGQPVALLEIVDLSPANGFANLEFLVDPVASESVAKELEVFVSEAFATHPDLRKLCVWSFEDEVEAERLLGSAARLVGRLVDHERRSEDRYVDVLVHEIWPSESGDGADVG
jgi:hypothetical protein